MATILHLSPYPHPLPCDCNSATRDRTHIFTLDSGPVMCFGQWDVGRDLKCACAAEFFLLFLCHHHEKSFSAPEKSSCPFTLDPSMNPHGANLSPTWALPAARSQVQLDPQLEVGPTSQTQVDHATPNWPTDKWERKISFHRELNN